MIKINLMREINSTAKKSMKALASISEAIGFVEKSTALGI